MRTHPASISTHGRTVCWLLRLAGCCLWLGSAGFQAAIAQTVETRIEMEITAPPAAQVEASQKWGMALNRMGLASVRIKAAGTADRIALESIGTADQPAYRIYGKLDAAGLLVLPTGRYALADTGKLSAMLDELRANGPPAEPGQLFGLTKEQFAAVHEDLVPAVGFATLAVSRREIMDKIVAQLRWPVQISDDVATAADLDSPCSEELETMTRGTALAFVIRDAGLAFVPERRPGGNFRYILANASSRPEWWPVGWKPDAPRSRVAPKMAETLNTAMEGVSLQEALDALRTRLEIPFLYDGYALARFGIDPQQVVLDIPETRTTYSTLLSKALASGRLKYELRIDEAAQPFLWITSLRRVED